MSLLDTKVSGQVTEFFKALQNPVTIEIYSGPDAEAAKVMADLINEVADLSDLVMVTTTSVAPVLEPGHPGPEGITGPIAEILDHTGQRTGVRFVGLPSGHEFGAFLEAIKAVSTNTPNLSQYAMETLARIQSPLHIQVFTTPT